MFPHKLRSSLAAHEQFHRLTAQADEQAGIDATYERCSQSWVDATASNGIEKIQSFIALDDLQATIDEGKSELERFCRDTDIERYCEALASAVAEHSVRGFSSTDQRDFEEGCRARYGRDIAVSIAINVGDCIVYTASSAVTADCSQPHDASVIDIWEIPDESLPDLEAIEQYFYDHCPARAVTYLYPTSETWAAGDRKIVCLEE